MIQIASTEMDSGEGNKRVNQPVFSYHSSTEYSIDAVVEYRVAFKSQYHILWE